MVIGLIFQWDVDPEDAIDMEGVTIGANLTDVENAVGVMGGLDGQE